MKIRKIHFEAYGPFTNVPLEIDHGRSDMVIIYGANEAGKSSALRGLKSWLFGFPRTAVDHFIHESKSLRIHGQLENLRGENLEFTRRKGIRNTLLSSDGKTPLTETALNAFTGDVSRDLFDALFGINHEDLVRGGEALLREDGDVGKALFSASLGNRQVEDLLNELDERAQSLYKPRGSTQAIAKAVTEFDEAKAVEKDRLVLPREWEQIQGRIAQVDDKLTENEQALLDARAQLSKLEKMGQAIPLISQREDLTQRRGEMGSVKLLADDFSERRVSVEQEKRASLQSMQESGERLQSLEEQLKQVEVRDEVLAAEREILQVQEKASRYKQLFASLEGWRTRVDQLDGEIASLRLGFEAQSIDGSNASFENLLSKRARLDELVSDWTTLNAKRETLQERQKELEEKLSAAQIQLGQTSKAPSLFNLQSALKRARSHGELDARIVDLEMQLSERTQDVQQKLSRLPLWSGDISRIQAVALPFAETIEQFSQRFQTIERELSGFREKQGELVESIAENRRRQSELELQGDLPTEMMLADARAAREVVWDQLKDSLIPLERSSLDEPFLVEATGLVDVAINHVDTVSDRLRREADRVQQYAICELQAKTLEKRQEQLRCDLEEASNRQKELNNDWFELWKEFAFTPYSPEEMRPWLTLVKDLRREADQCETERLAIDQHRALREQEVASLTAAIQDFNVAASPTEWLADCVERAEFAYTTATKTAQERSDREKSVEQLKVETTSGKAHLDQIAEHLDIWESSWHQLLTASGLSDDIRPQELMPLLEGMMKLRQALRNRAEAAETIVEANQEIEAFEKNVDLIVNRILPQWAGRDAGACANALVRLLATMKDALARREVLQESLAAENQHREEINLSLVSHEQQLTFLCDEAGGCKPDELAKIDAASTEARALSTRIAALDEQVDTLLGRALAAEMKSELGNIDVDRLAAESQALADRIKKDLEPQRSALAEKKGQLSKELELLDHGVEAAEAAEAAQQALAAVEKFSREYLRVKVAAYLLREEIERYRLKNQQPVISRASELFRQLTLGSFTRLETGFGRDDELVFEGIRSKLQDSVEVSGMSSGTRDQLYLALRLATLEKYLSDDASIEPMPFIVDDILIEFDEARTEAALEALLDFSRRTQVLLFTHHQHVVDAAQRVGGNSVQVLTLTA